MIEACLEQLVFGREKTHKVKWLLTTMDSYCWV